MRFFLHGAMRCDFERQITRDDAMRWICSNHTGRCDAMGFRILKTRGDAMRWVSEIRKHGAMRCDEKRHDGRFIAIDLGIAWAMFLVMSTQMSGLWTLTICRETQVVRWRGAPQCGAEPATDQRIGMKKFDALFCCCLLFARLAVCARNPKFEWSSWTFKRSNPLSASLTVSNADRVVVPAFAYPPNRLSTGGI